MKPPKLKPLLRPKVTTTHDMGYQGSSKKVMHGDSLFRMGGQKETTISGYGSKTRTLKEGGRLTGTGKVALAGGVATGSVAAKKKVKKSDSFSAFGVDHGE